MGSIVSLDLSTVFSEGIWRLKSIESIDQNQYFCWLSHQQLSPKRKNKRVIYLSTAKKQQYLLPMCQQSNYSLKRKIMALGKMCCLLASITIILHLCISSFLPIRSRSVWCPHFRGHTRYSPVWCPCGRLPFLSGIWGRPAGCSWCQRPRTLRFSSPVRFGCW